MNKQAKPCGCVSVRAQTSQLVNHLAILSGESSSELLNRAYDQLLYHYGVNLRICSYSNTEELLTVAERLDVIDKVYAFAYAERLYWQASEQ